MIGKISDPRGTRVEPLIYYLFGAGRREEHTDPHLIAGWRNPAELEPPPRPDGRRDFRKLTGLLLQPHAALGPRGFDRPVWHCAVRAAPEDRMLSEREWAQIAGDIMHRTGLAQHGQDDDAVRWVAVRHGDDHVHIVAVLARQDGGRPRLSNERYRLREACRAAEGRYGLRRTAPGDRTAPRRATRAENEKSARRGRSEAPRVTLRRAVSTATAGAPSEQEFFDRLAAAGVLVRKRLSTRQPSEVTGYAVALPGDTSRMGGPVWFGGGKLAADLTLPKLRQRWEPDRLMSADPFTAQERNAIWEHAARTAADAAAEIHALARTSPASAADAAWAAADTLHVAAATLGSRIIRQAADSLDRAARAPYGRIPCPTRTGNGLRRSARLLAAAGLTSSGRGNAQTMLIIRLAGLAAAIADLRDAQSLAAQAAAARSAAQHLHTASAGSRQPLLDRPAATRTAAGAASLAFPFAPGTPPSGLAKTRTSGPGKPSRRPSRGPALPRPRGPTR
ncbi:MAG: relaxase/mobilization nuclease domain-containing protein [Streptosporangiaceae bacterium]